MQTTKKIIQIYEKNFIDYGDTFKGVGWNNSKNAIKRYTEISKLFNGVNKKISIKPIKENLREILAKSNKVVNLKGKLLE